MTSHAVIVAPGRGTYNKGELGTLKRHHGDKAHLLSIFDAEREMHGQTSVSSLDGAAHFSVATHTRGDNASPLIYCCSLFDFLDIDRAQVEIVAVTGNSMGWYTALACAGAVTPRDGFRIVNTMGGLMHASGIGGQLIYPFVDEDWRPIPGRREEICDIVAEIGGRRGHTLTVSIRLGGMLVLAGNEYGLSAFEAEIPVVQGRFPLRLPNHAAFHSHLQMEVAAQGRAQLGPDLFQQPDLPLIDGRGHIWHPKASSIAAMHDYTFGHQVVETYDFSRAVQTAAREFMPDIFIVLGPGTTLGSATAQSLLSCSWRGLSSKGTFKVRQAKAPCLISMGDRHQSADYRRPQSK